MIHVTGSLICDKCGDSYLIIFELDDPKQVGAAGHKLRDRAFHAGWRSLGPELGRALRRLLRALCADRPRGASGETY